MGSGEGPAFVAEELRLEERLRNGCAVEPYVIGRGPTAVEVDGTGDEFLARPTFAQDQHGGIRRRHCLDQLPQFLHLR